MAIMLNPNAIPKGSITQEMIDASTFEGIYELLTAGYALNLVGKGNGEPQAFMSRKTGGGNITDGSAVIKEVDGVQPIVWNQYAKSANVNAISPVAINRTIDGFTATAPAGSQEKAVRHKAFNIVGHKYYVSFEYTSNLDFKVQDMNTTNIQMAATSNFVRWSKVGAYDRSDYTTLYWYLYDTTTEVWTLVVRNYMCIDLTQMFGAGNEPSTYEEYLDRISHYHIKDAYAYNAGEVVNYKGVGVKTTNVDGTKTYVRDWSEVMQKYFPDGMTSLNGVKDFFNDKKAVRKWGCKVFDGTEEWRLLAAESNQVFEINIGDMAIHLASLACNLYAHTTISPANAIFVDGQISTYAHFRIQSISIKDSTYTSLAAWKAHLTDLYAQGNPLVVYYELSEPVEDIFEKPLNLTYTVINGGTETSLATENSTQFEGSIFYGKDYVGVIDELQLQNRVTQIEFENWEN